MNIERARRAREVFGQAIERDPSERDTYVRSHCADDSGMRREVESLLVAYVSANEFLEDSATDCIQPDAPGDKAMVGRCIGACTVRRQIGAGGMGVVYEADQKHPRRTVALKLMRAGFTGSDRLRRFRHEVDMLGRLQHPGIAQVFDAGVLEEAGVSIPYFTMEYVAEARDIITFARERGLNRDAKLDLLARVCDAVEHGHQRGVIHRDLKPGNVLIDSTGRPKVIDFGVARLSDPDSGAATLHTKTGLLVGTLRYMSPEQCRGADREVDTGTDTYSLGVILYELLTNAFPYDLDAPSPFEIPRVICDVEPRRPSSIDRALRGDVETIVLKALSKDRTRRYASVGDLARDLRHFQKREPIDARRDSGWYVARKTLRRHWIAATVAATFLMICAVSAASLAFLYRHAESRRTQAVDALKLAEAREYFNSIAAAHAALREGDTQQLLRRLSECPQHLRRWEWHYLRRLGDVSLKTFDDGPVCKFVAGGSRIFTYNQNGFVRILDAATGRVVREYQSRNSILRCAALSPDEHLLVTGGDDCLVRFWNASTGKPIAAQHGDIARIVSAEFSPDGSRIVTGGFDRGVKMWNPETGKHLGTLAAEYSAVKAAFSPDGQFLACATDDGRLLLWDLNSQSAIHLMKAHDAPMLLPAFSPDGKFVATAALDTFVKLWHVDTGDLIRTIECGTQSPNAISFSPDNRRLAVAARAVRVWDLTTGIEEATRLGHIGFAVTASFSPDGRTIVSGGRDGTLKLWDARPFEEPGLLRGHTDFVRAVAVLPDGRRITSTGRDGTIRIWNVATGEQIDQLEGHGPVDQELALSRDGRLLVSGGWDGRIRIHDVESGSTLHTTDAGHARICGVAISPDGREIASVGTDGICRFWSASDGTRLAELDLAGGRLWDLAYSNSGGRFIACGEDRNIYVYNRRELRQVHVLAGHEDYVLRATFSPDDRRIASAAADGTVRVWDAESGAMLHVLRGHDGVVQSIAFLPDGSRLISGGYDHVINVWDPNRGTLVLTLRGHKGGIPWLAVSPDGSWFASASNDHTIGVWRTDKAPPALLLRPTSPK